MEGVKQFSYDEVLELIKEFNIGVPFNKIVVTLNVFEDEDGLLTDEGFDNVQYVVAAGPRSFVKEGTKVALDLEKLVVTTTLPEDQYQKVQHFQIKTVEYNGYKFGLIDDNVVEYFYK